MGKSHSKPRFSHSAPVSPLCSRKTLGRNSCRKREAQFTDSPAAQKRANSTPNTMRISLTDLTRRFRRQFLQRSEKEGSNSGSIGTPPDSSTDGMSPLKPETPYQCQRHAAPASGDGEDWVCCFNGITTSGVGGTTDSPHLSKSTSVMHRHTTAGAAALLQERRQDKAVSFDLQLPVRDACTTTSASTFPCPLRHSAVPTVYSTSTPATMTRPLSSPESPTWTGRLPKPTVVHPSVYSGSPTVPSTPRWHSPNSGGRLYTRPSPYNRVSRQESSPISKGSATGSVSGDGVYELGNLERVLKALAGPDAASPIRPLPNLMKITPKPYSPVQAATAPPPPRPPLLLTPTSVNLKPTSEDVFIESIYEEPSPSLTRTDGHDSRLSPNLSLCSLNSDDLMMNTADSISVSSTTFDSVDLGRENRSRKERLSSGMSSVPLKDPLGYKKLESVTECSNDDLLDSRVPREGGGGDATSVQRSTKMTRASSQRSPRLGPCACANPDNCNARYCSSWTERRKRLRRRLRSLPGRASPGSSLLGAYTELSVNVGAEAGSTHLGERTVVLPASDHRQLLQEMQAVKLTLLKLRRLLNEDQWHLPLFQQQLGEISSTRSSRARPSLPTQWFGSGAMGSSPSQSPLRSSIHESSEDGHRPVLRRSRTISGPATGTVPMTPTSTTTTTSRTSFSEDTLSLEVPDSEAATNSASDPPTMEPPSSETPVPNEDCRLSLESDAVIQLIENLTQLQEENQQPNLMPNLMESPMLT